jgi:hypothetical protein
MGVTSTPSTASARKWTSMAKRTPPGPDAAQMFVVDRCTGNGTRTEATFPTASDAPSAARASATATRT